MSKTARKSKEAEGRPAVEWIVGIASAVLVAALILFLGYEALLTDTRPPELSAVVEGIEQSEKGTVVSVAVTNRGDEAASAVTVLALPREESADIPPKEIEFDYIAGGAVRHGAFVFSRRVASVDVEVGGFTEP